ncbi:MAG: M28 family peptidase, partial [Actinomycetota bacterium]
MRYLSAVLLLLAVACRPQARPIPPIPRATPSASSSPSQFVPGPVPSPTPSPPSPLVASVERALQHDRVLSVDIGPRVSGTPGEKAAADYLNKALTEAGLEVRRQRFTRTDGGESENIIGRIPGVDYSTGYFVIGGHYDTVVGSPGGNDNGSGTALTVAIAEVVSKRSLPVEFIAFASEERHPV